MHYNSVIKKNFEPITNST